ncbi:MAG: phosphoglycerate dehydrogenase [Candidatus Latescibacteria bacterium]|nr:phosphoglycerate dehydrogenase [Candidatus Latescibacterota bacterium]
MYRVLISDNVAQECIDILEAVPEIEVDFKTKLSPDELKAIIGDYDALVVRSATKVLEDVIAEAKKLKVIGRAGSGIDNIDVAKATDAGIVVLNTPGGNTVSTAEHAFSLMMALSRNISQGDHSIKEGLWDRKKLMGVELRGKTLGIIGLGNVGQVMADRAAAFKMKVLGIDPFISKEIAQRHGIKLTTLDEVWAESDYITVHTLLSDKTHHMINAETLDKCKDGVRIINCARGGIINEKDLLKAIDSGKVAGAALDVYENEPPGESSIVMDERVICTPHLGASTAEAQDIVAAMVAEQIRDFLLHGEVRNAVNMPSMASEMFEEVKPFMNLCRNMGAMLGQLGKGQLTSFEITYYGGDLHRFDTWPITSSALEGLFTRGYAEGINLINALITAEKLGIKVNEIKSSEEKNFKNCIKVTTNTDSGDLSILGTIFGKHSPRVVNFQGFELDFVPEGHMLICGNKDRPGIIGNIGTVLGKKGINIAHMTWSRKSPAGEAIVVLNTDDAVDKKILDEINAIDNIEWAVCLEI